MNLEDLQNADSPLADREEATRYRAALAYLFDRPVSQQEGQEWYWHEDEQDVFEATPLEWTRIQTALFCNAAVDLRPFSNDQLALGMNYLINNSISDVPFAAIDETVPIDEAMSMMRAMPRFWRECIGPRLASGRETDHSGDGRLSQTCYMWFDVCPTFFAVRHVPAWRDALWHVFAEMLKVPNREVQIAALHGIGHRGRDFDDPLIIRHAVHAFIDGLDGADQALEDHALAALARNVL